MPESTLKKITNNLKDPVSYLRWAGYQLSRGNNVYFNSMQQAGTHWLRYMLAISLSEYFQLEGDERMEPQALIPAFRGKPGRFQCEDRLEVPRIFHSHNQYRLPYSPLYRRGKVLLLVRDLRDSLASRFRKETTAFGFEELTFSEYLRSGRGPYHVGQCSSLADRVAFLNGWGDQMGSLRGVLLVRYEDLKAAPAQGLLRVLHWLGLRGAERAFCQAVVERCSIDRMRQAEKAQRGRNVAINKGAVGGHEAYFSDADREYFLAYLRRHLRHPFGYTYA